jgi:aromatic-L-amino-acid decarboxylase
LEKSFHMTSGEFRAAGKQLIDWLADYYEQVQRYPVLAQVAPGEIRAALPPEPPAVAHGFSADIAERGREDYAGDNALAVAELFCVFPGECFGGVRFGRSAFVGLGSAGNAVGH